MPAGSPLTLLNAFDRATRWFAGNEAVVDSATRLSYAQLDEMSRRTAALLRANGLVPGRPVAILAVPSAIYLVAWFGIVRAGGLPMALHVRESGRGLATVCDKMKSPLLIYDLSLDGLAAEVLANSTYVVSSVGLRSALSEVRAPAVRPSAVVPDDLARYSAELPPIVAKEDDAAVIALSSGTTSVPKGVVHTQRSLVELARTDVYLYGGIRPGDRSLVPLSTAFIGCTNGWLPFINAGACVIFMEKFDLDELVRRAAAERVTHVFLTPTLWRRVLNSDLAGVDFGAVRQVGFAAEPMDAPTLRRLRERISPNVVQMYGSTETGAAATCIWAEEMVGDRLTSVGRPMLNGDLRVVVPGGGPNDEVVRGEAGEILVTSPSLAAGIWDDPALTAKAFIEADGRRWWRSGDLGRLDADGFLFIEGRHDDMIISGGINIMPAPVEEALLTHPGVRECAVVGMPDPEWGERVEAFVVVGEQAVDGAALDQHLRAGSLSPYQRPRAYTFVAELPRTPTHKINRRALRERAPTQTEAQRS
jgi:fatty-acyl-CoA synthase